MASNNLTANGLTVKTYQQILDGLVASLNNKFGSTIDVSEESILGIINTIYAASLSDIWELSQAVYNSFNIDTATGKQLDDLVQYVGIERLTGAPTQGNLAFFSSTSTNGGINSFTINAGAVFTDGTNNFSNPEPIIVGLQRASFFQIRATDFGMPPAGTYTVTIDSVNYSHTTDGTETREQVHNALRTALLPKALEAGGNVIATSSFLSFSTADVSGSLNVSLTSNINLQSFRSAGRVQAPSDGPVAAPAATIDTISSVTLVDAANNPVPREALTSVTNPTSLVVGRVRETDEQLRSRQQISVAISGSSTVEALRSNIGQVNGVSSVQILENDTNSTVNGLPPKSFSAIVEGGADQDVGQVIWQKKAAGIQTVGTRSITVEDSSGNNQIVRFSRPTTQNVWVRVMYTLNPEETFPTTGQADIARIVLEEGNKLSVGEDVFAGKFLGPIYQGVSGIGPLTVQISDNGVVFLNPSISIPAATISSFDPSRITVTVL